MDRLSCFQNPYCTTKRVPSWKRQAESPWKGLARSRSVLHRAESCVTILTVIIGLACTSRPFHQPRGKPDFAAQRQQMVRDQLEGREIYDRRVLEAMGKVPRHELVPEDQKRFAYLDRPLPIGFGQTISQPFIVALMTQSVDPQPGDKVLEVGTGSGYQAAVMAELCSQVFTIEIVEGLAERAAADLERLGYENITVRAGDGYAGWASQAPFDIIIITAAAEEIPQPLIDQLADGGRLIMPIGPVYAIQELTLIRRQGDELIRSQITPVRFVPLTRKPG